MLQHIWCKVPPFHFPIATVLVKIESRPFAAGAMRECYAMKKLSTFYTPAEQQWVRAPNCVAKRYKKQVDDAVYFDDVRLQMDSKALGEMYNKTDPPKKVDFVQSYVLLFPSRDERTVFSVEHLIEGDYVRWCCCCWRSWWWCWRMVSLKDGVF